MQVERPFLFKISGGNEHVSILMVVFAHITVGPVIIQEIGPCQWNPAGVRLNNGGVRIYDVTLAVVSYSSG